MTDPNWFEEKPSLETKNRVEAAADREIDRRARLTQPERRGFLQFLNFNILAGGSLAGLAGLIGFKIVADDSDVDELLGSDDAELIADIDFLEDFEILEGLTDEELAI